MKTVHIVYGPPLAGKSTFVRENMGPDDLVFDMDAVQNALCYGADHAGKPHTLGAAIALRNAFIAYLNNKRQDGRGDAWVIISSASPEYFARRFFGARIEVTRLLPPLDVCLKRLELDDTRPTRAFGGKRCANGSTNTPRNTGPCTGPTQTRQNRGRKMLETIILTAFGGAMLFALEVVAFSMGVAVGREVAHKDADYMAEDDEKTVFDPRADREEYIGMEHTHGEDDEEIDK